MSLDVSLKAPTNRSATPGRPNVPSPSISQPTPFRRTFARSRTPRATLQIFRLIAGFGHCSVMDDCVSEIPAIARVSGPARVVPSAPLYVPSMFATPGPTDQSPVPDMTAWISSDTRTWKLSIFHASASATVVNVQPGIPAHHQRNIPPDPQAREPVGWKRQVEAVTPSCRRLSADRMVCPGSRETTSSSLPGTKSPGSWSVLSRAPAAQHGGLIPKAPAPE